MWSSTPHTKQNKHTTKCAVQLCMTETSHWTLPWIEAVTEDDLVDLSGDLVVEDAEEDLAETAEVEDDLVVVGQLREVCSRQI